MDDTFDLEDLKKEAKRVKYCGNAFLKRVAEVNRRIAEAIGSGGMAGEERPLELERLRTGMLSKATEWKDALAEEEDKLEVADEAPGAAGFVPCAAPPPLVHERRDALHHDPNLHRRRRGRGGGGR